MNQGGRILVVDDETLVRETVGSLLADEGYVVDEAIDGADAIAKVTAHRPDAILLDLMMPGMNGRQFLDALRDLGHGNVPVVVMTAVQGLAQGVGRLGATDVIEKPFDLDDLLNKVALAVYRSSEVDEGAPRARTSRPTRPYSRPAGPAAADAPLDADADAGVARDRGVVLLVDRDRTALQRIDALLSARGYTVVTMTRVTAQLPRLARALEPRAIILDIESGLGDVVDLGVLRGTPGLRDVPILLFARAGTMSTPEDPATTAVLMPVDEDLVRFVDGTPR